MEQYLINGIEWVNDNRCWIMPIVATGVLALLIYVGRDLAMDIRDEVEK